MSGKNSLDFRIDRASGLDMKSPSKTGRKRRDHITAEGETIVGLSRMSDCRWRLIGTQIRFTEADEQEAVKRFRRLTDHLTGAQRRMVERPNRFVPTEDDCCRCVVETLETRPKWLAEKTGIEWLAYGPSIKPPQPLPSPSYPLFVFQSFVIAQV